jgi:hypothetical protein
MPAIIVYYMLSFCFLWKVYDKKQTFPHCKGHLKCHYRCLMETLKTIPRPKKKSDLELCIVEGNYREQIC